MFVSFRKGDIAVFASVVLLVVLIGCQMRSPVGESPGELEVARVDEYKIIVSDFRTAVVPYIEVKSGAVSDNEIKKAVLDDLVTRKVLVEEAQREGLDKQQSFMREIERYWEQSLLKLLLKKKIEELSSSLRNEEERQEAFDKWVERLKSKAVVRVNEDVLESIDLKKLRQGK